jgi:hypothetical protein
MGNEEATLTACSNARTFWERALDVSYLTETGPRRNNVRLVEVAR